MARLINAAADFVTEGERRTAEALRTLPDDWVVIANKVLVAPGGRSYEIDFLVVGDRMVFVIDEKGWRGKIHGSDAIWVRADGSSERSPLGKADYVAKVVAGYLRDRVNGFAGLENHPVTSGVILSRADERPHLKDLRADDGVMLLDDAVAMLRSRDARGGDPRLATMRDRIVTEFHDLRHRPKTPKAIGSYSVRETLSSMEEVRRFRAVHADDADQAERLLSVYPAVHGDEVRRDFYLREFRSLRQLRHTGVVPEVLDSFEWSEDFLVVPSRLPAGISLAALPLPNDPPSALREIQRAASAFRALAKVHAAGVVHRAIGPDSVYVHGADDAPAVMLTGFFAARHGGQTITAQLDELSLEDRYAAPEIAVVGSYGFASDGSDVFSLALVWLERIAGAPLSRLMDATRTVTVPDEEHAWPYLPQPVAQDLRDAFAAALSPGPLAAAGSTAAERPGATAVAEMLTKALRHTQPDPLSPGTLLDGRYQVVRVLGEGATARTILARDRLADGLFALKQFLRPAGMDVAGSARHEFNVLRDHPHPHLPRVYDLYEPERAVHVKMEFIDGPRLSEELPGYLGNVDRCWRLAGDLLNAVAHLESRGLLHRDIKPENVVFRAESNDAILVDVGAAAPVGTRIGAAGTPGFLPPEAYLAPEPPPSTDRYAVAAILFQALTGRLPFAGNGINLEQRPLSDDALADLAADVLPVARVLLRAVSRDPEQRPGSASELRALIDAAVETSPERERTVIEEDGGVYDPTLTDRVNPVVDQIRGLFRNSAHGNADNRGLDTAFARETYVPTALDIALLPAIFARHPRVVFLSGNPGDGKTAFLERVQSALRDRGGEQVSVDDSGWEWRLSGHTYRACYDASESHGGKSADEQLLERLAGLEGPEGGRDNLTVLVAINDGRLADFAERKLDQFPWLADQTERALDPNSARAAGGVWLIDLKRRAYVSLRQDPASPSVMRRVLQTLTAPERWSVCEGCTAKAVCPIRRNALALGEAGGIAAARLEHLALLSHLRQGRHLTIRDLRSGLAALITGDTGCDDIHAARHAGSPLPAVEFWRTVFATETGRDIMLGELRPMDPARSPQPLLERYLYFHRDPIDEPRRAKLFADGADVPPEADPAAWMAQIKRRLYFHGRRVGDPESDAPMVPWPTLLPYRLAAQFINALDAEHGHLDDPGPAGLLAKLVRGIGRSDRLNGPVLDGALCLKVAHSDVNRLTILKRFPLAEFTLTVRRHSAGDLVEALPEALELHHAASNARLTVTLDLFELLLRFADGLEPTGPELQPLLEDLAPFKSRVQLSEPEDLVILESGQRLHRLTQRHGKVVREPFRLEA